MSLKGVSLPSTPITTFKDMNTSKRRFLATPLSLPVLSNGPSLHMTNRAVPRLNPLHPPGVKRRTVSLETVAVHHHNHQRVLNMQQKEYYNYHQGWRRPFYGTVFEQEEYRKEIRDLLKKQMYEKWALQREVLSSQSLELEAQKENDRTALMQDLEQQRTRAMLMRNFRDENKKIMETKWQENRLTRSLENMKERELLHYNPINWSGTLK
ncbi:uncharacterized protein LOC134568843 isoform X1 [Pelobates fuscus]|uniref:uncharacterized protein LOC134568843 isoform X1 n=1 Tax=Pelobates fuscus TaxID=191477 RepID=UPI002FE436B2